MMMSEILDQAISLDGDHLSLVGLDLVVVPPDIGVKYPIQFIFCWVNVFVCLLDLLKELLPFRHSLYMTV